MKDEPKISIVTPSYNSEKYIERCIISIKNQKYTNYEHIIVDGGSTDNTLNIIKRYENTYPMKWISEIDHGMYDAINKGFNMAEGNIYAWINSDDFYFPWTLQTVAKAFVRKEVNWLIGIPSVTKTFNNMEITYLMPNLPAVFCRNMIKKGVYDGRQMYFIQQESCFWSRDLWDRSGGLDIRYQMAGDYFLWVKFAQMEPLYTIHCNLASFRIHSTQKSKDIDRYYKEINRKKHFKIFNVLLIAYLHFYSLKNYRKFVINIDEVYNLEG